MRGADALGTDLGAQRLDVAVDGARPEGLMPTPHLLQETLAGQDRAGRGGQGNKKVKLERRETNFFARHMNSAGRGVDRESTDRQCCPRRRRQFSGALDAAQQGFDAGNQFAHPKGLVR